MYSLMPGGAEQQFQSRAGLPVSQIREQLNRILASETFVRSERLSTFLRFVVDETLRGNGGTLKEQVIAHDVYGRGEEYDPSTDPVVRVDARRLRDKLREYYSLAGDEPVIIRLPKGSYVPSFERRSPIIAAVLPEAEPISLPPAPSRSRAYWLLAAGALLVGVAATTWYGLRREAPPTIRIRPLTSLPGVVNQSSLSPDGNFVAFAWNKDGPADLYVKAVDSESQHRLTETPQNESSPAWSPDGREIAFIRAGQGVFIMSVLGGAERLIGDRASRVRWSANSKSVFVSDTCTGETTVPCIYQIDLDTLKKRQITKAGSHTGDSAFAASPDGRTLAIVRESMRRGVSDVFVVGLDGGEVRRITSQTNLVMGVDWTPDGNYLMYSTLEGMRFRLWRTAADGSAGNGQPVTPPGESANHVSIARQAGASGTIRVAFSTMFQDVSLKWVDFKPTGPADPVGTAIPWADAAEGRDCNAKFSPD